MHLGPGLQTPDFQKNLEYLAPDSRLQISRKNLESTPRLQTPDFRKTSGVPGPRTPDSRFPEKIWSTGAPDSRLQISRKNLEYLQTPDSRLQTPESGVQGPGLQIFLEIWSLESGGTPDFFWKSGVWSLEVLQISSGNLESGVWRYSRFLLEISSLESGGTPDFFWKSGVWSPPPRKTRLAEAKCVDHGGGGASIYIYIYIHIYGSVSRVPQGGGAGTKP